MRLYIVDKVFYRLILEVVRKANKRLKQGGSKLDGELAMIIFIVCGIILTGIRIWYDIKRYK